VLVSLAGVYGFVASAFHLPTLPERSAGRVTRVAAVAILSLLLVPPAIILLLTYGLFRTTAFPWTLAILSCGAALLSFRRDAGKSDSSIPTRLPRGEVLRFEVLNHGPERRRGCRLSRNRGRQTPITAGATLRRCRQALTKVLHRFRHQSLAKIYCHGFRLPTASAV
jgi:hypothetical protein